MKTTYTYGPTGLLNRTNLQTNQDVWYLFDPQGNVAQRLDASGKVLSTDQYDAWGNLTNGGDTTDPCGYRAQFGYYTDHETGVILCGHRYYDPVAGRWLTRDPIGVSGGINLYAYCGGDAVGKIDPSGNWGLQFGNMNIGIGDPALVFDKSSWVDLGKGTCSALDGVIPFWDPMAKVYANSDGTVDYEFVVSRKLGGFSRDVAIIAVTPNFAVWAKNPVLYEIGQKTLTTMPEALEALTAIERGAQIVKNSGWIRALIPELNQIPYGETFFTGLTPGSTVFSIIGLEAADQGKLNGIWCKIRSLGDWTQW